MLLAPLHLVEREGCVIRERINTVNLNLKTMDFILADSLQMWQANF